MEPYLILLAAFVMMLASLSGVIVLWKTAGAFIKNNVRFLVSFAIGVFAVTTYDLFVEGFATSTDTFILIVGALLGALLLELVTQLNPNRHHHHGTEHDHGHTKTDARRLLLGDAIHNVADGIVLVPVFLIDIRLGIATAIGIFLHELVQEISEFFVLKEAGYTTRRALILNFIASSTILIGVGIGLYATQAPLFESMLITFAAGAFLYVLLRDLVPSTLRTIKRRKQPLMHVSAVTLGVALMASVGALTPGHTHTGIDDGHDHASDIHAH